MTTPTPPQKLLTLSSGGWVLLLAIFFTFVAAALVLYPVYTTGFHQAIGDGKNPDTYGFDLSSLTIPKSQLVASGTPKDGIVSIPTSLVETITPAQVKLIADNEHIRFLVPADRVIGVVINGEARAYPVRILALHELVNDTLANTPIAVTYAPLCDSALVFDRRIDGPSAPPLEFGISGLLLDSNSIYFDRRKNPHDESLWPQLALHAIAGPAAKEQKPLPLVPFELTTYEAWTRAHPDTRVLLGLRTHKTEYSSDLYSTYMATDAPKFPVSPRWPHPTPRQKTPITVTSTDAGKTWKATLTNAPPTTATSAAATSPAQPPVIKLYSFLFAWYAQHPNDTDYSALPQ